MRRRQFITLLGGAAASWPLAARAQQPAMPVIGFLHPAVPEAFAHLAVAFRKGLSETGYVDGRNVTIEYRWARGHDDRLPGLAAELVRHQAAAIFAGPNVSALVAKATTATIPIVFAVGSDPVKIGLVASLNRPGGNVTGVTFLATALQAKRMGLLRELAPQAAVIAVLVNPNQPDAETRFSEAKEAARALGRQVLVLNAKAESDIDAAFAILVQQHAGGLIVEGDPFLFSRREQLIALAARHAIPTIYNQSAFAAAGGLASYGTSLAEAYHQAGAYTGRILKGEKPADLPVVRSTKFEFVLNLKTAKALGLIIPPGVLAIADEVIE